MEVHQIGGHVSAQHLVIKGQINRRYIRIYKSPRCLPALSQRGGSNELPDMHDKVY